MNDNRFSFAMQAALNLYTLRGPQEPPRPRPMQPPVPEEKKDGGDPTVENTAQEVTPDEKHSL